MHIQVKWLGDLCFEEHYSKIEVGAAVKSQSVVTLI